MFHLFNRYQILLIIFSCLDLICYLNDYDDVTFPFTSELRKHESIDEINVVDHSYCASCTESKCTLCGVVLFPLCVIKNSTVQVKRMGNEMVNLTFYTTGRFDQQLQGPSIKRLKEIARNITYRILS